MDILRIMIGALVGTTMMTIFSYLISVGFQKLYKEPVLLKYLLLKAGASLTKKETAAGGWILHYAIGILFAVLFILIMGVSWLQQPDLLSAILFGLVTVLFPFLIMQPCLGMGFFASKTAKPWQACLKSSAVHTLFGVGLVMSIQLLNVLGA